MSMTLEKWNAARDALAALFPVGARVECVEEYLGVACYGVVTGHTSMSVEWREDDGTKWRMHPSSLRVVESGAGGAA